MHNLVLLVCTLGVVPAAMSQERPVALDLLYAVAGVADTSALTLGEVLPELATLLPGDAVALGTVRRSMDSENGIIVARNPAEAAAAAQAY